MSNYSVNASAESPGSCPNSPPSCYSPCGVENIFASNAHIDPETLQDIATGLVQTVKNHKEIHRFAVLAFKDKIKRLESTIEGYAKTYERAPDRYVRNTMYPDLKIPLGEGVYAEAYWVTPAHNGYVQAYRQEQGPLDTPYSLPSMLGLSIHLSPSIPFLPGSTNSWSVPPPFTLTSPKQPTDLMTGASLRISRTTANWTTTCPVSMQNSNGSKLKPGRLGL